jgi:ribonuclease VapC
MFIDHSVIAAMMTDEDAARRFAQRLQAAVNRITSPVETARAAVDVSRKLQLPAVEAGNAVATLLQLLNVQVLAVPPRASTLAVEAYQLYGAPLHPAVLSLDDCMAYACARYYRQPLLTAIAAFQSTEIELA